MTLLDRLADPDVADAFDECVDLYVIGCARDDATYMERIGRRFTAPLAGHSAATTACRRPSLRPLPPPARWPTSLW